MKQLTGFLAVLAALISILGAPAADASGAKQGQADAASSQAAEQLKEIASVDALSNWMTHYYENPQPELMVPALLFADKQGLIQGDAAAPLQAFTSRVFAQNPDRVKEWFTRLGPIGENGKNIVLTAIWWSNTSQGKELLQTIASQLPEKGKREFKKEIEGTPPAVETMEIVTPDVLDMLWASFTATGDTKYVKRLITTLSWERKDSKDLPKMLIANAARWSLISNINQHAKVKEFCQTYLAQADADTKPYLEKALAEAEAKASADKEKEKQACDKRPLKDKKPGKDKQAARDKQPDKSNPADTAR
jgi:hypothetical protein